MGGVKRSNPERKLGQNFPHFFPPKNEELDKRDYMMTQKAQNKQVSLKENLIIKKSHVCGHLSESSSELERCLKCSKAFLPLKYFVKVHEQTGEKYQELFSSSDELAEDDLAKGLYVLW